MNCNSFLTRLVTFLLFFPPAGAGAAGLFIDFDDLPPTGTGQVPASSSGWLYMSKNTNPDSNYPMTAYDSSGWRTLTGYPGAPNIHSFFYFYIGGYNSSHMGFEKYGYFEIDERQAVNGNSLKVVITGGKNEQSCAGAAGDSCVNSFGRRMGSKEQYLDYLSRGIDPVERSRIVGAPYLYFMNNSPSPAPLPIPESPGSNRLSLYMYVPSFVSNGTGGREHPPGLTVHVGPFNGTGGHWYNSFYTQGGGWTHYLVDGHPQHNNAWHNASLYPYPSSSMRSMGYEYFRLMYRWYVAGIPYDPGWGGVPPYSLWLDEIKFIDDREPQNDETIASPSLLYRADSKSFEIGFNDKYKNNQYSFSLYEVRYSFSPITNANWAQATPAHILKDERFAIAERSDGKFAKWWPYYQNVWAAFKLAAPADEAQLVPGRKIYVAIKDISQVNGDGPEPVRNCGIGGWQTCGRDYAAHGSTFDYAGDQPALRLIKRIDFQLPAPAVVVDTLAPAPPQRLYRQIN